MSQLKLSEPEIDACLDCGSEHVEEVDSGWERTENDEGETFDDPWVVYHCDDCDRYVTIFHDLDGHSRDIFHGKNSPKS